MVLGVLTGWLHRREREATAYLIEENRLLRRQLGGRRLRLTDDDRRRLAVRAFPPPTRHRPISGNALHYQILRIPRYLLLQPSRRARCFRNPNCIATGG